MAYKYHYKKPSKTKKNYKIFLGLIIVIAIIVTAIGLNYNPQTQPSTTPTPTCGDGICQSSESCSTCLVDCGQCTAPAMLDGNLLVALKDDPVKLIGGNVVLSLNLTVKSIQVHRAGTNETDNNITAAGWITISNDSKTFDILNYTGDIIALIGENELEPGDYTQIRLYVSNAAARINVLVSGGSLIPFSYNLTIPSKVLKLIHPFTIVSNKTLVLTLDFDVQDSVIRPAGTWTLKPTIKTVTEETLERGQTPEGSVLIPES